jgi:hypothetical protein
MYHPFLLMTIKTKNPLLEPFIISFQSILKASVPVAKQVLGMRIVNLNSTIWIGQIKGRTLLQAILIQFFL